MVDMDIHSAMFLSSQLASKFEAVFMQKTLKDMNKPLKLLYDMIRIIGLTITVSIDRTLVSIASNELPKDATVADQKQTLVRALISLCWNSAILRVDDVKQREANLKHLLFSKDNFQETINQLHLQNEFSMAIAYHEGLKGLGQNRQLDTTQWSCESGWNPLAASQFKERRVEYDERVKNWTQWQQTDSTFFK